jgi:hypothetical protein
VVGEGAEVGEFVGGARSEGGEGGVTPPGREEKRGVVEALEGEGAGGFGGAVLVEAGEAEAEVDAAFVRDEVDRFDEVAFGGGGVGDDEEPAEIEVGDFLVGVEREGCAEEGDGLRGVGGSAATGEGERADVEFGRGIGRPSKATRASERSVRPPRIRAASTGGRGDGAATAVGGGEEAERSAAQIATAKAKTGTSSCQSPRAKTA